MRLTNQTFIIGVGDIPYDDTRCPRLLKNIILECWEGKDLDIPDILMQLKQMQSFVPKEMSLSPWEEVSPEEIAGQKKEHIGQGSFGIGNDTNQPPSTLY